MKISKLLCAFAISALSVTNVMAQQTYEEMEQLTVNEQVTRAYSLCGYFY